jgi:hypothetical protein
MARFAAAAKRARFTKNRVGVHNERDFLTRWAAKRAASSKKSLRCSQWARFLNSLGGKTRRVF